MVFPPAPMPAETVALPALQIVAPVADVGGLQEIKVTQEMVALKPVFTTDPSDVKRRVSGPVVEVIVGGMVVQLPLNKTAPPVPAPSNTVT